MINLIERNSRTFRKGTLFYGGKTANLCINLYARIEPDVKEQVESILLALGIPMLNAINIFYKQIILNRAI